MATNIIREVLIELYHYTYTMAGMSYFVSDGDASSPATELYNSCCDYQDIIVGITETINLPDDEDRKRAVSGETSKKLRETIKEVDTLKKDLYDFVNSKKGENPEFPSILEVLDTFSILDNLEYV